jgi:hypothetical protein
MPENESLRIVVADGMSAAEVAKSAETPPSAPIQVVFETDDLSSEEIAAFVDLVDFWLQTGRSVRLHDAPQMLAHTLYKVGRLDRSGRLTVSVRGTEPYPG